MQKRKKSNSHIFFITVIVVVFMIMVMELGKLGILSQSALSSNEKGFNYETNFNVNVKTGEIGTSTRLSTNPSDKGSSPPSSAKELTKVKTGNTQKNGNDGVASQTSPSTSAN